MVPTRRTPPPNRPLASPARPSESVPVSDAELAEAVASGRKRVARELYRRLIGSIDSTLFRIIGQRGSDHDDLVQTAFEQVVMTLVNRRYAGACSLTTWATSIATHVGLNAIRSRRVERKFFDRDLDLGQADDRADRQNVEREIGARRDLDRVREALVRVDPDKAKALFLHDVLGHDLAEVAAMTGVSVSAAQSRLVRGRRSLYKKLGHEPPKRGGGTS